MDINQIEQDLPDVYGLKRLQIFERLSAFPRTEVRTYLEALTRDECKSIETRGAALVTFVLLDFDHSLQITEEMLNDKLPEIRFAACMLIHDVGTSAMARSLRPLAASDPNVDVRSMAIWALRERGGHADLEFLKSLKNVDVSDSGERSLREMASTAIQCIEHRLSTKAITN